MAAFGADVTEPGGTDALDDLADAGSPASDVPAGPALHDPDTAPLELDEEPLVDLAEPELEPERPEPDPPKAPSLPQQPELDLDLEPLYDDEENDRP
jgi:hypothetical protein